MWSAGPGGRAPRAAAAAALWGRGAGAAPAPRSRCCHGCQVALAAEGACQSPRRALGFASPLSARAGEARREEREVFARGVLGGQGQAPRGGGDLPEGGRGNLRSRCQEPTPSMLVCPGSGVPSERPPRTRARVGGEPAPGRIGAAGLERGSTASLSAVGRGVLCSRSTLPAFLAKRAEKGAGGGRERLS